jgi:hypothetical protein
MEQVISLKNKTNRMLHINLVHPKAPRVSHVHNKLTLDAKSGKRGVRVERLGVYGSLTLLAKEEQHMLPVWVADTPDVQRLRKQQKVSVSDPVDKVILAAKLAYDADEAKEVADALRKQRQRKAEKKRKLAEQRILKLVPKPAEGAEPADKPVGKSAPKRTTKKSKS